MANKTKLGTASVMMLLIIATAPALLCASYLAQTPKTHDCCPSKSNVVPTCCVYAPAVTSQSVDVQVPTFAVAAIVALDPLAGSGSVQSLAVPDFDTSPPGCSSILRI